MSFSYARRNANPVTYYYIEAGAYRSTKHWRNYIALLVLGFVFAGLLGLTIYNMPAVGADVPQPAKPAALAIAPELTPKQPVNQLQLDVDQWLNRHHKSSWSVSVRAIKGSDISAGSGAHQKIPLASVYKLFLLQPLMLSAPANTWQNTNLNSRTYADCVDAMLRHSDNPCAEAIGEKVGWSKADKYLNSLGYIQTTFMDRGRASGTAAETSQLLQNIYEGQGFDNAARELALNSMSAPKKKEAVRLSCQECKVYNKTGDLGSVHNDAAIIEKDGKTYVVVILSDRSNWHEMAELSAVITAHL